MKRSILSLLAILMTIMAWADNVTVQQALQQAQRFIQQREDAGSRPKRVKGSAASQLTMVNQFSGLYLFNVGDNGGFVVVSNDDRTLPILGFSDKGVIDPDNMPDNMRAWLQGYADEIAWAKEHMPNNTKATTAGAVKTPCRVGSHSTAAIAPLVTARWDQSTPFNDLCPEYSSGKKSATGCVATAMAQVMYYHKWPQAATAVIPAYTTSGYGINMPSLPATTFDWDNMLDEYSNHWNGSNWESLPDYTAVQGTAVATLMQYCGSSILMNYGPSSGANTDKVASALREYFGYNKSTTQFVSRSFYTAAKWADLMYHELANGRPVVYGGQSSSNGHEFVCDGYQYADGTDFFHINWGWGGLSDDYFVLSALDPHAQGIGGSSSTDGYHFGQDAVIGIQPSISDVPIADITPNTINLTLNSMTPTSATTSCYMPVSITLNITNNSSDDYDGDIYLGQYGYGLLQGTNAFIAAGETKDVVVPFIPNETGQYGLVLFLPDGTGLYSLSSGVGSMVTVTEGQINDYVPIYGYYCDEYSKSQFIIPAANLEDMAHSTLNSVTFYASALSAISWGSAQFDVCLKEVTESSFASASLYDWSTLEKVYSGSLSVGSDGKMTITFSNPFQYEGGNLLVGINQTQPGSYVKVSWCGSTASSASLGGYNTKLEKQDFLPMTTFDYTPGSNSTPKPKNISVTPAGTSALVTWTGYEHATGYNVQYRTAAKSPVVFEDDFEKGLGKWTIYTEGEAPGPKGWYIFNPLNNGFDFEAHSGSYVASAWSWNNATYNADNWLITPQVVIGNELRFWVRTFPSYSDSYEVLLSTTGNAIKDFNVVLQAKAPAPTNGVWNEVVIDLSAYAGYQGYIAIHHVDYDKNYLFIDDFGIYEQAAEEGEWQNASATQTSKLLTGLTPLTTYELQVQGVYPAGTSAWTSTTTFLTTDAAFILGDANGDDKVDITDALCIVNYLVGNPPADFNAAAADVNGDGKITIADAVIVMNVMMNE